MRLFVLLLLIVSAAGCAPSVAPLYRDYAIPLGASASANAGPVSTSATGTVVERLRAALHAAGWTEAAALTPDLVATEPRTLRNWGLYRLDVTLEVLPIRERYVRVFVHPVRHYVTGGRTKLASLDPSLRRALFPDLDAALAAEGFERVE